MIGGWRSEETGDEDGVRSVLSQFRFPPPRSQTLGPPRSRHQPTSGVVAPCSAVTLPTLRRRNQRVPPGPAELGQKSGLEGGGPNVGSGPSATVKASRT